MRMTALAVLACLSANIATAHAAGTVILSEGNWDLRKAGDKPADGSACVLAPKQQSRIQIAHDRLEVTGLPKKSILNFQYIVDEAPASRAMFPSPEMQDAGTIWLDGDVLQSVVEGQRLRIRVLDRWHEAIAEDLSLQGLRSLYLKMNDACK